MNEPNIQDEFSVNSQLQQQQINAHTAYNAPYLANAQREVQAALMEQTNPARTVKEIRLTLKGMYEDDFSGEVKQDGEPLMNDLGIGNSMIMVKSVVNKDTIMSALDERKINKLMLRLSDDLRDDLSLNWKEYGVKDKSKLDIIMTVIQNLSYICLLRALNGGERSFYGKTTIENISQQPRYMPPKKEGFWSRFKL